jgi:hypothetical protein
VIPGIPHKINTKKKIRRGHVIIETPLGQEGKCRTNAADIVGRELQPVAALKHHQSKDVVLRKQSCQIKSNAYLLRKCFSLHLRTHSAAKRYSHCIETLQSTVQMNAMPFFLATAGKAAPGRKFCIGSSAWPSENFLLATARSTARHGRRANN